MSEARHGDLSFTQFIFSDLQRYRVVATPRWRHVFARCLVEPGMIASLILRAQQCLFRAGHVRLAKILRTVGVIVVGADFVPGMTIGAAIFLPHPVGVTMGNSLEIRDHVTIAQGVTLGARLPDATVKQGYPVIDDGAILLAHATVVGGVRIGKHAQIGANSLVVADVPDFAVMLGVPARKVTTREREAAASALLPPSARPRLTE